MPLSAQAARFEGSIVLCASLATERDEFEEALPAWRAACRELRRHLPGVLVATLRLPLDTGVPDEAALQGEVDHDLTLRCSHSYNYHPEGVAQQFGRSQLRGGNRSLRLSRACPGTNRSPRPPAARKN